MERQKEDNQSQSKKMQELEQDFQSQQAQITQLQTQLTQLLTQSTNSENNQTITLASTAFLNQNQPNPFQQNTNIRYFIPEHIQIAYLQITTVDGKVLKKLDLPNKGVGQVMVKTTTYPAGTYYYSLILDGQIFETKRMVLTK